MSNPSTPPQAVHGIVYKCGVLPVCEFARAGKLEKVCKIMCMHVTVSSSHFWHAASPHASVRKQGGWQNLRCHGAGNCSSETNSNTLQRDTLPESMRISRPSVSSQVQWQRVGRVWHERAPNLILELLCCLLIYLVTLRVFQCVVGRESKERE